MSEQTAIGLLHAAHAFESLEFYCTKSENRGPVLNCRLFDGFQFLAKSDVEQIAQELNAAIGPVCDKWRGQLLAQARQAIPEAGGDGCT